LPFESDRQLQLGRRSVLSIAYAACRRRPDSSLQHFANVANLRFAAPGADRSISHGRHRLLNGGFREISRDCSNAPAAPCMNVEFGLAAAIDADIWNGSSVPKL
jgi:hypothetical protein